LSPFNVVTRGTNQNEDIYFQATEVRNNCYNKLPDIVNEYMEKISEKTGREYKPFVYYGDNEATRIIVAMGSVCETIKETIDYLNQNNEKVGLIEVHLYRPFSKKYFFNVLPNTVEKIAVLDRTKEPGSSGEPLYLDVVSLFANETKRPLTIGGRFGLSGKDTNPAQIKAVYDHLNNENPHGNFTIGIEDDVTELSLFTNGFKIDKPNVYEFLIYGFGSDGMVTCSKNLIKIMGDNTDIYVQGYFQYDSKKSGGITRSHLRFSKSPIKSTYYVSNPSVVVCSKESYLGKYDMLKGIKENGIFLFVTDKNEEEVIDLLSRDIKKLLATRNIKFYIIDAYELANKHGLKNKISMILETCIFKLTNMIDFDFVLEKIKENIIKDFSKKGNSVVESNLNVIEEAIDYLKEIKINSNWVNLEAEKESELIEENTNKVFKLANNLEGESLKVSDFIEYKDGSFIPGTTKLEKRGIAENVPRWNPDNCIQCNRCSLVCPHAVIRPFLLNKEEFSNAPDIVKKEAIDAMGTDYKFQIGISTLDCTGCGLCVQVCPGKNGKKALEMIPFDDQNKDDGSNYLINNVKTKEEQITPNIRGSQFQKPLFEYHGACAGCGETPYLKLLTQLFGNHMVIANATGCSSIYGASMPSTPYSVPWANSLFEDNAEYGYGMLLGNNTIRYRIKELMELNMDKVDDSTKTLFKKWLDNSDNYKITKEVYDKLDYDLVPFLKDIKIYIPYRSIWSIGGDGWAYDIGFGGIDHVLASNDNINILVLDTQVYSNTGGQSSKASAKGSIAKFTSSGKETAKKDLARIAMTYPNVYVAQISMGANMQQTLKAFMEAEAHDGPSIIIAYSTCIAHGIKDGMENTMEHEKLAVHSGFFTIFRYNAKNNTFSLDYKEPDFDTFYDFLMSENRFAMLKTINKEHGDELLEGVKQDAIRRFNYYKTLDYDLNKK